MRVATIDIGTNSVLLLVAEEGPRGLIAVEELATMTRLGESVDRTRSLSEAAIERTTACLARYATRIRELDVARVAVVGTSALRDATGGQAICAFVESRLGAELRIIGGREEARLMFAGATSGLEAPALHPRWAFDIGGGSTEVVRGVRAADGTLQLEYAESFDVGSVRMTERLVHSNPPAEAELEGISAALDDTFRDIPSVAQTSPPIGIAGTVTTLAAVSLGLVEYDGQRAHGHLLDEVEVRRVVGLLARLPAEARSRVPGLHPGRVDVIVAGGLVVLALLNRLGASALLVSDRGLRWGLAEDLVRGGS